MITRRGDWTVDDLDDLPDDGLRYELVDGVLLVSPAPSSAHQYAVGELMFLLRSWVPPDALVFAAPYEFRPTRARSVQPDLLVVRRADVEPWGVAEPPLLVVEVLSPGSRVTDRATKRLFYDETGVAAYWMVDPLAVTVTVLERDATGALVEVATAHGDDPLTLTHPFPVTLIPASLTLPPLQPEQVSPA